MNSNYNLPPGCTDRDIDRAAGRDRDRAIHDEYRPEEEFEREERGGFVVIKKKTAREITRYAQRVHELNMLDEEMAKRGVVIERGAKIPFLDLTPIAHRFAPARKLTVMEECARLEREVWREDLRQGIVAGLVILASSVVLVLLIKKFVEKFL